MRDRCAGKLRFPTQDEAAARMAVLPQRETSRVLVAYRCPDCRGWHLGHAPASDKKVRTRAEQLRRASRLATIGEIIEAKRGAA